MNSCCTSWLKGARITKYVTLHGVVQFSFLICDGYCTDISYFPFLSTVVALQVMNKWLKNFFQYLDRYFVKYHSLPTLEAAGVSAPYMPSHTDPA